MVHMSYMVYLISHKQHPSIFWPNNPNPVNQYAPTECKSKYRQPGVRQNGREVEESGLLFKGSMMRSSKECSRPRPRPRLLSSSCPRGQGQSL